METETIDLTIGGIEFSQCIVDFEYEYAGIITPDQPPYSEDLTIHRVQLEISDALGIYGSVWVDLQDISYGYIEEQVLDWIHTKQEQSKLDKQIEDRWL